MSGRRISAYATCIAAIALGPFSGVQPATATTAAEIVLVGGGTSTGMGFPCIPTEPSCRIFDPPMIKPDPKGTPWANGGGSGPVGAFQVTAACIDTKTAWAKPKVLLSPGLCLVTMGGAIRGYCNHFFIEGYFQYFASNGSQYGLTLKSVPIGGVHVVSGGTSRTHVHGILLIQHGPGCNTGSSTQLTVLGEVVLKDLTP